MVRGEASAFARGVKAQGVLNLVLDPVQHTKAGTKLVWVAPVARTEDGMIARGEGTFLGRLSGSVITRHRWEEPFHIDVTREHGRTSMTHAWSEIEDRDDGAWFRHVETVAMPAPIGWLWDVAVGRWFANSVRREVTELARLLEAGERGRGPGDA